MVTVAKKIENSVQLVIGSCFHLTAIKNVHLKPGEHAPNCSVTDCDQYVEWKLSSTESLLHVYVKEEKWEVVYRIIIDGKRERNRMRDHFARTFRWRSRCAQECAKSCIAKSEASFLIELTIDSTRKLVVEPPATVGLGLFSAALLHVSYDF